MRRVNNIIITDNIFNELSKYDGENVELLTHNVNRGMITVKVDDTVLTTSRSFGRSEDEAVKVVKKLDKMGLPIAGNPFLIGGLIAKQHLNELNINFTVKKPLITRFDASPRLLLYSDDDALSLWRDLSFIPHNTPVKKVNDDFIHVDVNSFGVLVFKNSLKLPRIISGFMEKMHELKYSESDECLRRALKYILVGYINSFLFRENYILSKVDYPPKLKSVLMREVIDGITKIYLPVGNDLYLISKSIVFSNIAVKYYETAKKVLDKLFSKFDGFILFGDDIYTLKKNVKMTMINNNIGDLKILDENIKLLMGTGLPPVFYGLKQVHDEKHAVGCEESNDCNIVGKREFEEHNGKQYEVIPHYFNFCDI